MRPVALKCWWCKRKVYRSVGRINEAKKSGWKTYCSIECQKRSLSKSREFYCARSDCNKVFLRAPHDIRSTTLYCSQSCAATVNNSRYPKRKTAIFQCPSCHKMFKGRQIYCSKVCKNQSQTIAGPDIIRKIREFYKKHSRIPLKIEFRHYGAAKDRFGSWNKAIVAAGFNPNPVMFAQRYTANDGHECDSLAEKIIDDWLTENNIAHKRKIPYPSSRTLTADFLIDNKLTEYFGLAGVLKNYDKLIQKKPRSRLPLNNKDN